MKWLAEVCQRVLARDGAAAGLREGRELGVRTGFEVAEEVAFYHGCTQVQLNVLSSRAPDEGGCIGAPPTLMKALRSLLRPVFDKLFARFHRLQSAGRMRNARNRHIFDIIACSLCRFGGASRRQNPQPSRQEQARALQQ